MPSNSVRIWVVLDEAQRLKFKSLGGSKWLREVLDVTPMPTIRASVGVGEEERLAIANTPGPAKAVARQFGVTVDFVTYMRRKVRGPHAEARRKREAKWQASGG